MHETVTDAKILEHIINNTHLRINNLFTNNAIEFSATRRDVIDALSKSITQNLLYLVSPEVYQRYTARLHVIDTLRDLSRLKEGLGRILPFKDVEESYNFLIYIFKKYTKPEHFSMCNDIDRLLQVADVVLNSLEKHKSLNKYFSEIVERILSLDQNERSERFFKYVIEMSVEHPHQLESSIVERIFVSLKVQLVEKPLTECFIAYCQDQNKEELQLKNISVFLKKVIGNPTLFSLLTSYFRELFIETKFAKVAQSFIKKVLEIIRKQCDEHHFHLVELYPKNLQHCVILLRISPNDHTKRSKKQAVESLREIFFNDYNDALMLVSNFPDWLPEYQELSENLDEIVAQKPDVICIE